MPGESREREPGSRSGPREEERSPAHYADRRSPAYYYGRSQAYGYGGYGGYGTPYYGAGEGEGGEESVFGSLTFARVLRVMTQRWPTLVVAVLLGLAGGFAYYKTAPVSYKAVSVIEMHVRPGKVLPTQVILDNPSTQGSTDEIFNTRLAKLRSREVIRMVAERVRADFPNLKELSDEEMYDLLYRDVEFTLQRRSRLVQIAARHSRPEIAQAIANAYAATAEIYSVDENKAQSESGVAFLKTTAEAQKRLVEKADEDFLAFRIANHIDVMENEKKATDLVLQQLNSDLARAESEQTRALELLAVLNTIQANPDKIASLPDSVPRSAEIAQAQQALQNALAERDALLMNYTDKHPEVLKLDNAVDVCRKQYLDAVWRARETAAANLELIDKQTQSLREKTAASEQRSAELEQKIVAARMQLEQLERERQVSDESYRAILKRMEEARLAYDENAATIKIVEPAAKPLRPVSPDPRVAFTAGPAAGLLLGFLFILLLDRLEDRVTSTADIERNMSTKVLALIPHVARIKRSELAVMSATRKFSRLAESVAGLRGLLESPRYRELARVVLVVSTQPEEGKTVVASNLALAYAMAGQKTLLVDFDLRRPRINRVFKVEPSAAANLADVLNAADPAAFDRLPLPSGFDNLDLVTARASAHLSPAAIMGSDMLPKFFQWARERYEHVIVDSPPFGLVGDAVVLATLSDSALIICRPDRSRYRAIRHAIRQLLEAGARLLGVVVNDVDFGRSAAFSNYDYRHYGYGYNYRYGRYGRYGYGYTSYSARRLGDVASAPATDDADDGEEAAAPVPGVLDVDDDEE